MAYGGKHVENRGPGALSWKHRGPTGLHAGKDLDVRLRGRLLLKEEAGLPTWAEMVGPTAGPSRNPRYYSEAALAGAVSTASVEHLRALEVRSAILATANLVDIHLAGRRCCPPWGENSYLHLGEKHERLSPATHLVFEDVTPLWPPIECRGALGLWAPPPDIAAELAESSRNCGGKRPADGI